MKMEEEQNDFQVKDQSFSSAGLHPFLCKILSQAGFCAPTPIQFHSIKEGVDNEDSLVCRSKSGTGKTLAFLSLILQNFIKMKQLGQKMTYCIIILPTRQLAVQVYQVYKRIQHIITRIKTENQQEKQWKLLLKNCNALLTIGGINFEDDRKKYRQNPPKIVVSTVGRLYEMMLQKVITFSQNFYLVLDEGDKLFGSKDQKFNKVIRQVPATSRWLVYSATYNKQILRTLINTKKHKYIQTTCSSQKLDVLITDKPEQQLEFNKQSQEEGDSSELNALKNIHRFFYEVNTTSNQSLLYTKISHLHQILKQLEYYKCLIFVSKKVFLEEISQSLSDLSPLLIHGGMSQAQRFRVMNQMNEKQVNLIITSDLLARGIDVHIDLVILFDIGDHDTFWHRVGRTGRYGRTGVVVALKQQQQLKSNQNNWSVFEANTINTMLQKARQSFNLKKNIEDKPQTQNKQQNQIISQIPNIENPHKNFWYGEHLTQLGNWIDYDPGQQLQNNYKYYVEQKDQNPKKYTIANIKSIKNTKDINKQIKLNNKESKMVVLDSNNPLNANGQTNISNQIQLPRFQNEEQLRKYLKINFFDCLECVGLMQAVNQLTGYEFEIMKYL